MSITVSVYDLISWAITIVAVTLFILERRKNNRLPYYMAVQGILRACKTKAGFYSAQVGQLKARNVGKGASIPMSEYVLFAETVYSDFASLMEHIMGSLKAIEPDKDMPFDTMAFTETKKIGNSGQEKS
jgi:hypothetical protein